MKFLIGLLVPILATLGLFTEQKTVATIKLPVRQQLVFNNPTAATTVQALMSNNTSACAYAGSSPWCTYSPFQGYYTYSGNSGVQTLVPVPSPGHTSTVSVKTILYSGFNGNAFAHYQPWWCTPGTGTPPRCNTHLVNGYNQGSTTTVAAQVAWAQTIGFNGFIVDWYGIGDTQTTNLNNTNTLTSYVASCYTTTCSGFKVGIMLDQGSFDASDQCPPTSSDDTSCIANAIIAASDYIDEHYSENTGWYWYDNCNGSCTSGPVVVTFINQASWPNTNWDSAGGVWAQVTAHTATYSHPIRWVDEYGSFTKSNFSGAFAWMQPAFYNQSSGTQYWWGNDSGTTPTYLYDYYADARTYQATSTILGVLFKGFDDSNTTYESAPYRLIGEQCGGLYQQEAAAITYESKFGSGNQLPNVGFATWNDYEEGHAIEVGVDNCWQAGGTLSGSTLTYTLTPTDSGFASLSTVNKIVVYYGDAFGNLWVAKDNITPATSGTVNLSGLVPPGNWYIWVWAQGSALMWDHLAGPVAYNNSNGVQPPGVVGSIYVSPSGSDSSGNGSPASPYATPQKASAVLRTTSANKKIVVFEGCPGTQACANGTYYLTSTWSLTSADSGISTTPIIYTTMPGTHATISGAANLSGGYTDDGSCGSGCEHWQKSLSSASVKNSEALYYNGVRVPRSRTTMTGYLNNVGTVCATTSSTRCPTASKGINGCSSTTYACGDRFQYNGTDVNFSYKNISIGDVEILDFEKWTMARLRLATSGGDGTNPCTSGSGTACLTGATNSGSSYGWQPGHRYLIEGGIPGTDTGFTATPNSWALDRNNCTSTSCTWTLHFFAAAGQNPNTGLVEMPQMSQVLTLNQANYIQFIGLDFAHDNWLPGASGQADIQGMPAETAAVSVKDSSYVAFVNDTFRNTQGWALEFVGSHGSNSITNGVIADNVFYDIGSGAVRLGSTASTSDTESNTPQFMLVLDNSIKGWGRFQPTGIGTGIWANNTHHNVVAYNTLTDSYSGGMAQGNDLNRSATTDGCFGGTGCNFDNLWANNLVYTVGQGVTSDMGGQYNAPNLSGDCSSWMWQQSYTNPSGGTQLVEAMMGGRPCTSILHSVFKDIVHAWEDTINATYVGYGGEGLYFDQGASNILARFNLTVRPAQAGFFQNVSDSTSDTYNTNNWLDNNIFAYSGSTASHTKQLVTRGGENPNSFFMTHNVKYENGPGNQKCGSSYITYQSCGKWSAYNCSGTSLGNPTTRWLDDWNILYDVSGTALSFTLTVPTTPADLCTPANPSSYTFTDTTLATWKSTYLEEVNSINSNPNFVNPACGTDDYRFTGSSPTSSVGITQFDWTQAGAPFSNQIAQTLPASVPAAFVTYPLTCAQY